MSQSTDNFTAIVTQLDTDVKSLVAALAAAKGGVQAAVDSFAEASASQVQAIDAEVKAALGS